MNYSIHQITENHTKIKVVVMAKNLSPESDNLGAPPQYNRKTSFPGAWEQALQLRLPMGLESDQEVSITSEMSY